LGLREQLRVLRANARIIIACLLVAAGIAVGLSLLLPKSWESENKLIVGNAIGANTPDYNALLLAQRLSQSYALVATTGPVLQHVIDELGLDVTVKELADHVSASAPRELNVIEIRASWSDPDMAAKIADAVSEELVRVTIAAGGRNAEILEFVDEELRLIAQQIDETRTQIDTLSEIDQQTPEESRLLDDLRNRLVELNATYASLLTYSSGTAANTLTVIEPAQPADEPASPRLLVNLLAAIVIGLLGGVGAAFVREQLDDSLRTPEQVASVLGLATLASIARMPELAGRDPIYRLTMSVFPRSSAAESFRMLRTNLEFASVDRRVQLIAVTSAVPGEGKTLIAANLAVAFAQAGHETILVDADLRDPEVHKLFGLSNTIGLTSLLRAPNQELSAAMQQTIEPKLRLLASGPQPPNPAELMGSTAMERVLGMLRATGGVVIFDTPPLQAVTDAAVLGASLDGTVIVAHAGRTGRGATRSALEALIRVDARILGVVLNLTTRQSIDAYGYYHSRDAGHDVPDAVQPTASGPVLAAYQRDVERTGRPEVNSAEPSPER
jgi:capsular exopolysaccharide synthesis family protein